MDPRCKNTRVRFVLIGLVAGFFSALFGVGGGVVIVPLLLLLCGWQARAATATSLAAIGITAVSGVIAYAIHGDVNVGYAALVGSARGRVRRGSDRAATATPDAHDRVALLRLHPRRRDLVVPEMTYALAIALGLVAGVLAGMFGIGGGILFVPTLIALGLGHHEALGHVAARDHPDGDGRDVAAGALRQRPLAGGAHSRRRRRSLGSGRSRSLRNRSPTRRSAACSQACSSLIAGQIAWRARHPQS